MGELRLEVREFESLTRWRWALTTPGGALVADHEVRLDAGCWQYEAFGDLLSYLHWHAAPDRRAEDEARIVAEVGAWIGEQVFGPVAAAMVKARPATVRVTVPAEVEGARSLIFRPLELAHVGASPDLVTASDLAGMLDLARERVTLITVSACWSAALSAGTPALFGARAVDLRLEAPRRAGAESYEVGALKMAGFPPQPDRFVGRTGVMARASAALADASGVPGVLLHGMPGGGKTACTLELAYTHEH